MSNVIEDLSPLVQDRSQWTLPALLAARSRSHGEKVFVTSPEEGRSATYAECHQAATIIAAALTARGGRPGDRMLIMAPNSLAYLQIWFGCSFAGLVELPLNVAYFGAILDHQVGTAAPRFAAIAPEHAATLAASDKVAEHVERIFLLGPKDEHGPAVELLQQAGFAVEDAAALLVDEYGAGSAPEDLPAPQPSDLAAILFTSGTTGPSKGVMNAHAQIHAFGEQVIALTRLTEDDTLMSVGPLFHANAQFLSVYPVLIAGARLVLYRKFSASSWLGWIRENEVTVTNFVGVMMSYVHSQPPTDQDRDHRLRCILTAPTSWEIVDDFKARFGVECVTENYGSTETSLPILSPYGTARPQGSCGLLLHDWFEARIADPETDEELPVGTVGELQLRPKLPWIMTLGYFNMPEKMASTLRNLWFHTGDALRQDDDGWYYFVDRINDSIRRRGENISSYEVEQPIVAHPDVEACAVVAVPADTGGEDEVMAVVVLRPGAALEPEELWEWCDEHLPAFARPRYLRIEAELPKTPSEKVQKAKLRELGVIGAFDRTV